MTLYTMLSRYYKNDKIELDLSVKNIYTDCITNKHIGIYKRQEIIKNKFLSGAKVENFEFENGIMTIKLYYKHKCTKEKHFEDINRWRKMYD